MIKTPTTTFKEYKPFVFTFTVSLSKIKRRSGTINAACLCLCVRYKISKCIAFLTKLTVRLQLIDSFFAFRFKVIRITTTWPHRRWKSESLVVSWYVIDKQEKCNHNNCNPVNSWWCTVSNIALQMIVVVVRTNNACDTRTINPKQVIVGHSIMGGAIWYQVLYLYEWYRFPFALVLLNDCLTVFFCWLLTRLLLCCCSLCAAAAASPPCCGAACCCATASVATVEQQQWAYTPSSSTAERPAEALPAARSITQSITQQQL